MGDSITVLNNGAYPNKVGELLGNQWGIVNKGYTSDTTAMMVARFTADITAHADCEYVIVQGGINDILRGRPPATIEGNLQAMYTTAHDVGIKVVAVSITPAGGWLNWDASKQTALEDVNTWMAGTAANVDYFIDAYSALEDPGNTEHLLPAYDFGDGLHLSQEAGSEALGTTVYNGAIWTPHPD
jgi:lysophospholipase L1-like esterase